MIGGTHSGCSSCTLSAMTEPERTPPSFVPYVPGPAQYTEPLPPMGPPTTSLPPVSPAPISTGAMPIQPPLAPGRRSLLIVALAVGAVVLVAAGIAGGVMVAGGKGPFGPRTFTVNGTLSLQNPDGYSASTTCIGKGGYADIDEGTAVTITDAATATVAIGRLGVGRIDDYGCTFGFSVSSVPAGKGFYGIEVSHRGVLKYSEADISKTTIKMSLGS